MTEFIGKAAAKAAPARTRSERRVLMLAYACNPQGSGEHWLGWGWAEQVARAYAVDLITTTNSQKEVEDAARRCGITAHFVSVPEKLRRMTEKPGSSGNWLRKFAWQTRAAQLAGELHRREPFALVHQTTFHTFRVPFAASRLVIPSVWGPIAGGESVPPGFGRYLGGARFSEFNRKLLNRLWLQVPAVRESLRRATAILVSNRTTLDFLPAAARKKCQIMPPNALRPEDEKLDPDPRPVRSGGAGLRLLYVGNCVATRAIPLVFDALLMSGLRDARLIVVGDGPALPEWRRQAERQGLKNSVEFVGKVAHAQLPTYYASADALVFPALRDSGGSALLEAMSRLVPVVCLDWAGPGEMVDGQSGIKIPVASPEGAVRAMAEAFVRLQKDPALGISLAAAARRRAQAQFRWEEKFQLLDSVYRRLMGT